MIKLEITGLDETIAQNNRLKAELPGVINAAVVEGTEDLRQAAGNYPTQPRSIAKRPVAYVRTMAYKNNLTVSYPDAMTGQVDSPTPYAEYVRGTDSRGPAWMHAGVWESLLEIVARLTQPLTDMFERRLEGLIYRIFGQ